MNELEILTKIYDRIKENGWESVTGLDSKMEATLILNKGLLKSVIFNHSIAKYFWGEEGIICNTCGKISYNKNEMYCKDCKCPLVDDYVSIKSGWKWHLQQAVIYKNPLKYMEKYL